MVTAGNFHINTFAVFTACAFPDCKPDFVSESGSKYWYEGDSVIRVSDHWGSRIASCAWFLNGETNATWQAGICSLAEFKQLNGKKVHQVPEHLMQWMPSDAEFVYSTTNGEFTYSFYAFEGIF